MRHLPPAPQLESLCRTALAVLFDHGAQVLSNEQLPGVGNSQILLRVLDIEFRIIQSSGSFSVYAAPSYAADRWRSIESLLMAIDSEHNLPPPPVYGSLPDLGNLLKSRLERLRDALSQERLASTLQAAREATMKEWIALKPRVAVQPSTGRKVVAAAVRGLAKTVQFLMRKPKGRSVFLPVGSDGELEQQVREEFADLFGNGGAQISSNTRMGTMDFATVTFDVGNLRVCASRDRGSVDVSIASIHAVRERHSLGLALQAIQENEGIPQSLPSSILRAAGRRFGRDFVTLNDAFSEAKYPATLRRIREISEAFKKNWIEDFNRKSKSYHATSP